MFLTSQSCDLTQTEHALNLQNKRKKKKKKKQAEYSYSTGLAVHDRYLADFRQSSTVIVKDFKLSIYKPSEM